MLGRTIALAVLAHLFWATAVCAQDEAVPLLAVAAGEAEHLLVDEELPRLERTAVALWHDPEEQAFTGLSWNLGGNRAGYAEEVRAGRSRRRLPVTDPCASRPCRPCRWSEPSCFNPCGRRAFNLKLSLPIWVPGVSGTVGTGGIEVENRRRGLAVLGAVGALSETVSGLRFGFVGRIDFKWRRLRISTETFGAGLQFDSGFRRLDGVGVRTRITAAFVSFYAGYELGTLCLRPGRGVCWPLEYGVILAARWNKAKLTLTPQNLPSVSGSRSWLDPLVGGWLRLKWSHRGWIGVDGNVGGGLTGSELAWFVRLSLGYRINRCWSVWAGYTRFFVKYVKDGPSNDPFTFKVQFSGPNLNVTFHF